MMTLIAILGAGAGRRMGGAKLDRMVAGRPLGAHVVDLAQGVATDLGANVLFIAPPQPPAFLAAYPALKVLANRQADQGMGTSLALAASAAQQMGAARLLVLLADMPFVAAADLHCLAAQATEDQPAACRYPDGRLGPPACFGTGSYGALMALAQARDQGARGLLNHPDYASAVDVAPATLADIDTPGDLATYACE